jgi:hypothetical protein
VQAWNAPGATAETGLSGQGAGGWTRYAAGQDSPRDPFRTMPPSPHLSGLTVFDSPLAGQEPPFLDLFAPEEPAATTPGSVHAVAFLPRTLPMVYHYPGSGTAYLTLPTGTDGSAPALRILDRSDPGRVHRLGPDGMERYPLAPGAILDLYPEPWVPGMECHLTDAEGKVTGSFELEVEPLPDLPGAGAGAGR